MHIRLSGILCQATGGASTVEVSGATIGDILTSLVQKHPAIQEHLDDGVAVAVNGEIYRDRRDQVIPEGSEVFLLPRIEGG